MKNLFDLIGLGTTNKTEDNTTSKKKKKSSKKKNARKKNGMMDTFDLGLFALFNNSNKNDMLSNFEIEEKPSQKKPSRIRTIITDTVEKVLDYLISKEPSSQKNKDRYNDNLKAIKVLNELERTNKIANKSQQNILAKYVGWGGLADKFKENSISNEDLKELLGENYSSARETITTAYYTNSVIIKFMYNVLTKLGFEKGRILDPSAGTMKFSMFMSEYMYYNSKIVAIEKDTISSKIAQNLFQSAKIYNTPYQEATLKNDSFDLIISNIPFGDIKIYDDQDKDLNKHNLYIHDYYFLKSIKKVRDKGIIAFITSIGTLDKTNNQVRKLIDNDCDFLGAVRLPSGAFGDTKVVSDIIFLQKNINKVKEDIYSDDEEDDKEKSKKKIDRSWLNSICYQEDIYINEYFINNPEMVLGDLEVVSGQFGKRLNVKNETTLNTNSFKKLFKYFPSDIYIAPIDDSYMFESDEILTCTDENIKNGEFIIKDNTIYQKQNTNLIPNSFTGVRKDKLTKYIIIKGTLKELISEQLNGCSDERLMELQNILNENYDTFVNRYGFINNKANKSILNDCILYCLVSSLENYDLRAKTYVKADIFSKRTIGAEKEFIPTNVDDAIALSFSTYARLDIEFMSNKLNRPYQDLKEELQSTRTIFFDPELGEYIYKDEYLSGYVKDKLKIAKAYAETDKSYLANVEALEANQPEYVSDVSFNLASTWIPADIKETFIKKILEIDEDKELRLLYTDRCGYTIEFNSWIAYSLNTMEWGTERREALTIVDAILNHKDLTVFDTVFRDGKDKRVKNAEQTQLAMSIATKWKAEFEGYVNSDPYLLKKIVDIYNDIFIIYKERKYSNIFNSLNINPNIKLRPHQLAAVSRMIISRNNTLLAHSVGAGKTIVSIAYAEESARIGRNLSISDNKNIKCKNLFVIPNHLCKSMQFSREYLNLYPQAKILSTTPEDFKPANRRKLISKIALGDFTSIIIPHSVLGMIPLRPSTEKKMLEEDLSELQATIDFYKDKDSRKSLKQLEKAKENFSSRIKELNDINVDDGMLFWEDLGITNVIIDEAHLYKNLFFPKNIQVAGVTNVAAKKSQDLFNKIRYQRSIYGEKGIIFMTATPISNSMCELYTMMRYLSKNVLEKFGIYSFDAFASNFGEIVANMEIDPCGTGFRMNRRFAKFCNIPELIDMFRQIADVVNIQDIDNIVLPKHVTDKPIIETLEPTEEMKEYISSLVDRAEAISNGGIDPSQDNMLKVTNEGRKLTVAPRLVGINQDSPKLLKLASILAKIRVDYPNGTNLIFCDLGTPKDDGTYSAYDELKQHCIANGIDESEIKYMHDAKTTEQRKQIIDDFNEGRFHILLTSTALGGEGTNFQKNIVNICHLDVPWKPSSILQRNGRAFRQGNTCSKVFEHRFVINSSFDAYSWQLIELKSKFINQILSATSSTRVAEDLESSTLDFETCKAAAANNPLLLELATVKREIQELQIMEKAYKNQLMMAMSTKVDKENKLKVVKDVLSRMKLDINILNENITENINVTLQDQEYTSELMAVTKLAELAKVKKTQKWGKIYGLAIEFNTDIKHGTLSYNVTVGENYKFNVGYKEYPKTMLQAIVNTKNSIKAKYQDFLSQESRLTKDLKSLEGKLTNGFSKKEELSKLLVLRNELETKLNLEGRI